LGSSAGDSVDDRRGDQRGCPVCVQDGPGMMSKFYANIERYNRLEVPPRLEINGASFSGVRLKRGYFTDCI
jgi:hypothetical protein